MSKEVFEQIDSTSSGARSGFLNTRRGKVLTPFFMPVATRAAVKGLAPEEVKATEAQVLLSNTYHLHLQPGDRAVQKMGGLHGFNRWEGPILTDSGGFQVFSLANVRKITEEGVKFKDPKSGENIFITPEKSMQIQFNLGSDIIMAFDDLAGLSLQDRKRSQEAVERTHRWLLRCIAEFKRLTKNLSDETSRVINTDDRQGAGEQRTEAYMPYGEVAAEPATPAGAVSAGRVPGSARKQASTLDKPGRPLLFGIVQGGLDQKMRASSLDFVQSQDVNGIAIGGLSVGESRQEMHGMLDFLAPLYDPKKVHYLMGVGPPIDMRYAIENGIDMFDCVLPTRNGRHGSIWITGDKKLNLRNGHFSADLSVLDEKCDCYTCVSGYSRAFLRHLFKVDDPLAGRLASIHNLRYLQRICEEYRS